jgi:ATP-dependent RNA helicase SUPV3L1/SUV3
MQPLQVAEVRATEAVTETDADTLQGAEVQLEGDAVAEADVAVAAEEVATPDVPTINVVETPAEEIAETQEVAQATPSEAEALDVPPATDEAAAAEDTGPKLIEIWHPHRPHNQRQPQRGQRDRNPRFSRPATAAAPTGEGEAVAASEAPKRDNRDQRRQHNRPSRGPQPQAHDQTAAASGEAPVKAEGKPGFDNRRGGKPPFKNPRPDDRRPERTNTAPRPPRERAPDPNSPFAKLLELKAKLENNSK